MSLIRAGWLPWCSLSRTAWLTSRGRRSGWAKVGSVVMALALVELVWFSFAFHLLSAGLNY